MLKRITVPGRLPRVYLDVSTVTHVTVAQDEILIYAASRPPVALSYKSAEDLSITLSNLGVKP